MGTGRAVFYNKIPLSDPSGSVTADDIDRIQQEIQDMATRIPVPAPPNVVTVSSDYKVNGTEDVLHVDAQKGPVKITLLQPSSANRPLTIKQVNVQAGKTSVNPVTIVTPDGSNAIAGKSSIALDATGTGSVSISADDQQHWPSTAAGGNPPVAPAGSGVVYVGDAPIYVVGNHIGIKLAPAPPAVTPWVAPVPFDGSGTFNVVGTGSEAFAAECMVDFTGAPGTLTAYLWFEASVTGGTGIVNVRIGGSAYRAIDGTVAATWSETSPTPTGRSVANAFAAPVGLQRVTLTTNCTTAQRLTISSLNLLFR